MTSFGKGQDHQNPEPAHDRHVDPRDPAPALFESNIPADDESERWATGGGKTVYGHGIAAFISRPEVADRSTGVGERCATEESLKKATNDYGADVGSDGNGDLEDDE